MYVPRMPDQPPSPPASDSQSMPLRPSSKTPMTTAAAGPLPQTVEHVTASDHQCSSGLHSVKSGAPAGLLNNAASRRKTDTESEEKERSGVAAGPRYPTAVIETYKTESLCIVCWGVEPSCMCMPCGHIAMCRACSQAVQEQTNVCPVCQQAITSLEEVLFV